MTTNPLRNRVQQKAYKLVLWQLVGVMLLAVLALPFSGLDNAYAVFAGGMAYGLPNLLFVWLVFRFVGANETTLFMTAFFAGEMFKMVISAILFLVIVKYLPVSLLSTLVGFIGAIVAFWIVCMWQFGKK